MQQAPGTETYKGASIFARKNQAKRKRFFFPIYSLLKENSLFFYAKFKNVKKTSNDFFCLQPPLVSYC